MEASSITILGGDLRQCYAAEYLASQGFAVMCCHTPDFPYQPGISRTDRLTEALGHSELILAPTPLTRDGANLLQAETCSPCPLETLWEKLTPNHRFAAASLPAGCLNALEAAGCEILAYGSLPFCQEQNARLTAEGLLAEVIRLTPFALSSASLLLIGYGCCGAAIARLFLPLCRNLHVIEQDAEKRSMAKNNGILPVSRKEFAKILPECQIIINTVPAPVLDTAQLAQLHSSCHIFDIASAPFGFPENTTEICLLPYYRIPGIPGRFSPASAGKIVGKAIERMAEHAI